jgi:hypothetical protein
MALMSMVRASKKISSQRRRNPEPIQQTEPKIEMATRIESAVYTFSTQRMPAENYHS